MMSYIPKNDWKPAEGINLTTEQNAVVQNVDKNLAIIAGPGTGKTEVLAQKATYLLQTGLCHAPFRILALCYKVDAAANIRERVQQRCPPDLSHRFQSMTVDAFLVSLIRRFSTSLPSWLQLQRDFEPIDKTDEVDYLRSSNTKTFPDSYTKKVNILTENVDSDTMNLYLYATNNNQIDYRMCHTLAYYIIKKNKNIRELISKTYQYIFLDEFQDVTDRHYEILQLLFCNDCNKISAVGDYNQAIMGWAGAIPDIFNKFKTDFGAIEYQFSYNHRSSSEIVAFINTVVQKLTPSHYVPIVYQTNKPFDSTSFISAKSFNSTAEEALYIVQCINKIRTDHKNLTLGDFAIILKQKTADYLKNSEKVFTSYHISVRNEDAKVCDKGATFQDLMVDSLSKLTIYLLKLKLGIITVTEQKELHYLLSVILSLNLDKPRDIKKLHETKRKIIKHEFISAQTWIKDIFSIIPKIQIFNNLYQNKKSFNEAGKAILSLLQKCIDTNNGNLPLAIDEYLGVNSVRLMTTHKSKGLEFDTVFFADFHVNSWWALDKLEQKEESLRCFFVGLSRAKKRLFFTSPIKGYPKDIAEILNDSKMVINYNP